MAKIFYKYRGPFNTNEVTEIIHGLHKASDKSFSFIGVSSNMIRIIIGNQDSPNPKDGGGQFQGLFHGNPPYDNLHYIIENVLQCKVPPWFHKKYPRNSKVIIRS